MSGQIDIKQALKKAYRKQRPTRAEIELVRLEFTKMLDRANPKESEAQYEDSFLAYAGPAISICAQEVSFTNSERNNAAVIAPP